MNKHTTAVRREQIAPFLARLEAPIAIVTDRTVGMAIGTPPAIKTTKLLIVGQKFALPKDPQFFPRITNCLFMERIN